MNLITKEQKINFCINWLKSRNIYEKFFKILKNQKGYSIEEFFNHIFRMDDAYQYKRLIIGYITWAETEEKGFYWEKIHNDWERIIGDDFEIPSSLSSLALQSDLINCWED